MINRFVMVATLGLLAPFTGGAQAQSPDGPLLANACTSCHGVEGRSVGSAPALAGQSATDLIAKLTAFRDTTTDATIMNRIARGYTDAEIAALAAYFSSVSAQ